MTDTGCFYCIKVDPPKAILTGPCEHCGAPEGVVELTALPRMSAAWCDGNLSAHGPHVWEMPGQGYWNCPGYDGKYQIGDRRWWWCLSDTSPMTRHKVVIEITEWRASSFVCKVVDADGSPDFKVGDTIYYGLHNIDLTRDMSDL